MSDDGTISPAGRFQRMEESLARIERKLDTKADRSDLNSTTVKVEKIELRLYAIVSGLVAAGIGANVTGLL